MFKRFISKVLLFVMVLNIMLPFISAQAFNTYSVETIVDAVVRESYYQSSDVIKNVKKGTTFTVIKEVINKYGNLWYKLKEGGYIYSERVKKVYYLTPALTSSYQPEEKLHYHNYTLISYGSTHPHYAEYKCYGCGSGYCSNETKKQQGCIECYPHTHNYEFVCYGGEHPHYAEYKCYGCGGGYCTTETNKQQGCIECYPHTHNYEFVYYGGEHPHYAEYKCYECGSVHCSTETITQKDCIECFPHLHEFEFVYYETLHPHFATYVCECGKTKTTTETNKQENCLQCSNSFVNETTLNNEHTHDYKFVTYAQVHPHYALYMCSCEQGYYEEHKVKVLSCATCYPENATGDTIPTVDIENHQCIFSFYGKTETVHPHYAIMECSVCGSCHVNENLKMSNEQCLLCYQKNDNPVDLYSSHDIVIYSVDSDVITYAPVELKNEILSGLETLHMTLDVFGLHPGYGVFFDGANVLLYLIEGKYMDMLISGACAVPIFGLVTGKGKVVQKSMMISTEVLSKVAIKQSKEQIAKQIVTNGPLTKLGKVIAKNFDTYSDEILETLVKGSKHDDVMLKSIFVNGDLILNNTYKGTITSPAGLRYSSINNKKNQFFHILDRHSNSVEAEFRYLYQNKIIKQDELHNFFNISDEEIFDVIDYAYTTLIPIGIGEEWGKLCLDYDIGRVIGTIGETKLRLVYDPNTLEVTTAFPIR